MVIYSIASSGVQAPTTEYVAWPAAPQAGTINRIAIITTIDRIAISTTIDRLAISTTINRLAIIAYTVVGQGQRWS